MEEPILAERWQEGENHMASVYDQHARTYGGPHVADLLEFSELTYKTIQVKWEGWA